MKVILSDCRVRSSHGVRWLYLLTVLLVSACKQPLAIVGEGDIVDLNNSGFGCSLEQFQAGDPACAENEVVDEDYRVNYSPRPRAGWRFERWEGTCGHLSEGDNCAYDVPAAFVTWFDSLGAGADGTPYTITAIFERESYSLGGSVAGLNGDLTLRLNELESLLVASQDQFQFSTPLPHESAYTVIVESHPQGQTCSVGNTSGSINAADIMDISIECTTDQYEVGGSVQGHNATVEITRDTGDSVEVLAGENAFSFGNFDFGTAINMEVTRQPAGQSCVIANGAMAVLQDDIAAQVTCSNLIFIDVTTTIAGLANDDELTVSVNGINTTTVNGSFITAVVAGSVPDIQLTAVPPRYSCDVVGDLSTAMDEPRSFSIYCENRRFNVSGAINGHNADVVVDLAGQGSQTVVPGAENFSFGQFEYGSALTMSLAVTPVNQDCTLVNGTTESLQDDLMAAVICTDIPTYDITTSVSGLVGDDTVTLRVDGSDLVIGNGDSIVTVLRDTLPAVSIEDVPDYYDCNLNGDTESPILTDRTLAFDCSLQQYNVTVSVDGLVGADSLELLLNEESYEVDAAGVVLNLTYGDTLAVTGDIPSQYNCPGFDAGIAVIERAEEYTIQCSEIRYNVSGKVLGLPDPTGLSVLATVGQDAVTAAAGPSGTFVFPSLANPGADISLMMQEGNTPVGFVCASDVNITNIQSDVIRQDIQCEPSASVTVLIDRVDPAGTFFVDLRVNGQSNVREVSAMETQLVFTDLPQTAEFDLIIDSQPENPGLCTIPNGDGTVGEGSAVTVECEFVISRMGLTPEFEGCVSQDGVHTYLQEVPVSLDCSARNIEDITGIGFLASRITGLDLASNRLTDHDLVELHPLKNLSYLALGDNVLIADNLAIADLENALPGALINLSNLATGPVEEFSLNLVFTEAALSMPEQLGVLSINTQYWRDDNLNPESMTRSYSSSVTRRLETTSANLETHALEYTVDLTGLDNSISCDPIAGLVEDQVVVSITCDRSDTDPDLSGMHTGLLPDSGLTVTVFGDNTRLRIDEAHDWNYLLVDNIFLENPGDAYLVANVPVGLFNVVPNTDENSQCTVSNTAGVLNTDRAGVDIDCTLAIAVLVSPEINTGLYDCLSLTPELTRLSLAAEVPAQVDCSQRNISDLTGLENFVQIEELLLENNLLSDDDFDQASDSIYGLPNLEFLSIAGNYNIRLSATLATLDTLLPLIDINTSNLNAAGSDRVLDVDITFSEEAAYYFDTFGSAVVGGVRLHGFEEDSFDNESDLLTMNGDGVTFFPVRDGSSAFLDYLMVRPGLSCAENLDINVDQDILLNSECGIARNDEFTLSLVGGGYDPQGREGGIVSGLEILYQAEFPYNDIYTSRLLSDLASGDTLVDVFPGDEADVSIQPGYALGAYTAPANVYCDNTPSVTMKPGRTFVLPCSQSIVYGSSTTYTASDSLFAGNQALYALQARVGGDLRVSATTSTDTRMQIVTGETQTTFTTGNNSQRVTLLDTNVSAGIPLVRDLSLDEDTYILAMQNQDLDFVGSFDISVTDLQGMESVALTLRPMILSAVSLGDWSGSFGAFTAEVLLNPAHTLTISSSDGGSEVASGAAVKIELESSTIDTYLVLTDDNGDVVALNDDSGNNNTTNSAIMTQLAPGDYQIIPATFADGVSGSYLIKVTSSVPAFTKITE